MPASNLPTHAAVARAFSQPARTGLQYPEYCSPRQPPADIHEDVFATPAQFSDDQLVLLARQALMTAREAAHRCRDIAEAVLNDPTLVEGGRHYNASEAIYKASNPALAKVEQARNKIADKVAGLREKLAGPPASISPVSHFQAMEARNVLANMKREDRRKTVLHAIATGDQLTAGAVLRCPAYLVGMDEAEQQDFRLRWQQASFPQEATYLAALQAVEEHVGRGAKLLLTYVLSLTSPVLVQAAKKVQERAASAVA